MPDQPDNPPIENSDADHEFDRTPINTPYGLVKPMPIVEEMQRSYLDYAMSVIVSRALPDVRDGLKPVHRRILYAMKDMGLTHSSSYKKSARIVGEVLGKYHPHGDSAVYDALVRLAQNFSMRYQLVDGQGNFGSIDGDSPAAMRYTEAKLAKITQELLADIDKNTVDFADNFDGSVQEPTVLPANLPNLLLMGSEGIAVGMATKIPPHNLNEVVDAIAKLIKKSQVVRSEVDNKQINKGANIGKVDPTHLTGKFTSDATVDDLLEHINGPDFPTASTIFDWSQIKDVYTTGKGRVIIRGKAEIEEDRGGRMKIVISEIPYQVNKAKLVAKIADLVKRKKLIGISDIRDESDRQGLSVVIDLKRDARPKSILNNLYKFTELQTTFPANMVALNSEGTPQLMNLKTILLEYIRHRQLVVTRRSQFELLAAQDRAHILEGLLIALNNLDAVIDTIRRSPDADVARQNLMSKFKLTEVQATAILDMQLRRLAALERKKIEDEYAAIKSRIDYLTDLLQDPQKLIDLIGEELQTVKENYGDPRATRVIKHKIGEFSEEDLVPQVEVIVTLTLSGYIKRMPPSTYKSQHRGGKGVAGMGTKEDDAVSHILSANTHDNLLIFTNKGKVFKLKVFELPEGSRQAKGQAIVNLIPIEQDETIQSVIPVSSKLEDIKDKYITLATKKGLVKKTAVSLFQNIRSTGIIAIILEADDKLVWGDITTGNKDLLMVTYHGKSIRFPETQIKSTARDTKGVMGIRLGKDDYVVTVESIDTGVKQPNDKRKKFFHDLLVITEKGMGKRTPFDEYPLQNRGGQGVKVMNLSPKTGNLAVALGVTQDIDQIIITTTSGQIVKLPLTGIPQLTRPTQGVILMRFAKNDDSAVAATAIEKDPDE